MKLLQLLLFFLLLSFLKISPLLAQKPQAGDSVFFVKKISLAGNKTTKNRIVLREMTFGQGDTIHAHNLKHHLERSRENLLNTPLFNFVEIDTMRSADSIAVFVKLQERWYTWPYIIFNHAERNFSQWLKNRDYSRIYYGLATDRYNFRGRNETLKFKLIAGYQERFEFYYKDIFLDPRRKHALTLYFGYARQHELPYMVAENQLLHFKDKEKYLIKSDKLMLVYSYRQHLYNRHSFFVNYRHLSIADTVARLNPQYLGNSATQRSFITLDYRFERKMVDSDVYPLEGYKFRLQITKNGIGWLDHHIASTHIESHFKYYKPLARRWNFAAAAKTKISPQNQDIYFLKEGLGYAENFAKGYEYYVMDGNHYLLLQNLLKFTILPTQVKVLKFIPFRKFRKIHYALYANAHFDMGYVWESAAGAENNPLTNTFLAGAGIGFDFVSYYDRILRLEYSWNKLGEGGIFIHFRAPI